MRVMRFRMPINSLRRYRRSRTKNYWTVMHLREHELRVQRASDSLYSVVGGIRNRLGGADLLLDLELVKLVKGKWNGNLETGLSMALFGGLFCDACHSIYHSCFSLCG